MAPLVSAAAAILVAGELLFAHAADAVANTYCTTTPFGETSFTWCSDGYRFGYGRPFGGHYGHREQVWRQHWGQHWRNQRPGVPAYPRRDGQIDRRFNWRDE